MCPLNFSLFRFLLLLFLNCFSFVRFLVSIVKVSELCFSFVRFLVSIVSLLLTGPLRYSYLSTCHYLFCCNFFLWSPSHRVQLFFSNLCITLLTCLLILCVYHASLTVFMSFFGDQ